MEFRKTYKAATKEKDCFGTCSCCVEREGKEIQMCCIGVEEGSEQCAETKKNVTENNYPEIGFCSTCKAVLHSGGHSLCSDCVSKVREYEKKYHCVVDIGLCGAPGPKISPWKKK